MDRILRIAARRRLAHWRFNILKNRGAGEEMQAAWQWVMRWDEKYHAERLLQGRVK